MEAELGGAWMRTEYRSWGMRCDANGPGKKRAKPQGGIYRTTSTVESIIRAVRGDTAARQK